MEREIPEDVSVDELPLECRDHEVEFAVKRDQEGELEVQAQKEMWLEDLGIVRVVFEVACRELISITRWISKL